MNDSSSPLIEQNPDAIACRLMQKAQNQDGLPEIAIGLTLLTGTGLQWLQLAYRPGSPQYKAAWWGYMLLIPALILVSQWAIKTVRRKFLIDRVGYVELKPVNRKRFWMVFCIAFVVAFAITFAIAAKSIPAKSWLLAITGIGGGILAIQAGRLPRFVVGGVLMAATGIFLLLMGVSLEVGLTILFGAMGLLSLVSGSVVFLLFTRNQGEAGESGTGH
jgi:hypothetical protein